METFQNLILPLTVCAVIMYGILNKLPVFEIFLKGAKRAVSGTADLLPALTALCLTVSALSASGALEITGRLLSPVCSLLGIPEEVLPLCIIAPLSGSGSLSVLEELFSNFSPDSYIGRTASVIAGASETTFYAVAVYFGSVGITRTRHTIPAALAADITNCIGAALFCRII